MANKNNVIAYVINESDGVFSDPKIIKNKPDSVVTEAILQDFDRNRNRRFYKEKDIVEGLSAPHIQEMLKMNAWYGECGHPIEDNIKRQMRIDRTNSTHRILSYKHNKGSNISAILETSMFPMGLAQRDEIRLGVKVSYSMRGMGPVIELPNGNIDVGSPLKILTYDSVTYPSHITAYQTGIISEDVSLYSKPLQPEKKLIAISEEVMSEFINSSENVNKIVEAGDIDMSKAKLMFFENFSTIILEDNLNKLIIKLDTNLVNSKNYRDYLISNFSEEV